MFEGKDVTVLLALAGTGKSYRLMQYMEEELKTRRPEEIAFVTFTRRGVQEGLERMQKKFGLTKDDLPYVSTIHSLTFHALDYKAKQILTYFDMKDFNKEYGYFINRAEAKDSLIIHRTQDTMALDYYDMERTGVLSVQDKANFPVPEAYYRLLCKRYDEFKKERDKVDFFDCLLNYKKYGESLPCKVVMVDECFAPNTKVRMADMSIKEIKDIKIGEYVMGTGSKPVKVTALHKGTDTMYDVKSMKGDLIFTCNSKHLIKQYTGYITDEWRHAEELTKDSFGVYVDRQNYKQPKQTATWARVQVVEKGIGEYVGITVEADNHLFLLSNGAVVHNCQDLTLLQWQVVEKAFANAEKVYLAGDVMQCIFSYSGSKPEFLINLAKKYKTEKLLMSYRVPTKINELANALISFMQSEITTRGVPRPENGLGSIESLANFEQLLPAINPVVQPKSSCSWYILARSNYFLVDIQAQLESKLIPYWNHDGFFMGGVIMQRIKAYYKYRLQGYKNEDKKLKFMQDYKIVDFNRPITDCALFDSERSAVYQAYLDLYGLPLLEAMEKWTPQILVSTIHTVKGGEAENVALLLDLTKKCKETMQENLEEELRVLYVAVTRAKKNLYLIDSKNCQGYDNIIQICKSEFGLDF